MLAVVRAYRKAMREFALMRNLDVWYSRLDAEALAARVQAENSKPSAKAFSRAVAGETYRFSAAGFFQINHELLEPIIEEAIGAATGELDGAAGRVARRAHADRRAEDA